MQGPIHDLTGRDGAFDLAVARVSSATGNPIVTLLSIVMVLAWFATGEHYRWSDTWQLVIQTIATVITLPLLFILQASHNRQARAVNAKLDAILRAQAAFLDGVRGEDMPRHVRDDVLAALEIH